MPKTKTKMVIEHLWKYGEINTYDAQLLYGIANLSPIIRRLQEEGCEIKKVRLNAIDNQCVYKLNREVENGQE